MSVDAQHGATNKAYAKPGPPGNPSTLKQRGALGLPKPKQTPEGV